MKRSGAAILIGGAAIILGLGLVVYKSQNPDRTNYPPAVASNSVTINNQSAAAVVMVESAILETPGFVALYEANGSRLGKLIGTSPLLAPGENRPVFVTARTEKGKDYFAALYADDGNSTFNERGDDIMKDESGDEIRVRFRAL